MRFLKLLLIFTTTSALAAPDAYDIMKRVDDRYDGESTTSIQTLLLANSKNQKKTRQLKSFSKEYGEDTKSVVFLLKPAEVRNMAFLSHNWSESNKEDESWMYMPALDRVDRLPASDRKNAFMGSDFSFSDMDGFELDEWEYTLISEDEEIDGKACYLIEATPKKEFRNQILEETGYDKVEHWISKELYFTLQSRMYFLNSSKNKLLSIQDIKDVDGILTPFKMSMRTYKGERLEHASLLLINEVMYNENLDDSIFTASQLRHSPL